MEDRWSPWTDINQPNSYSSHAVYQLRFVDASGRPCSFNRFIGTDAAGLLYIGERASMTQARADIVVGIKDWDKHMAGIMIHILNRYSKVFRQHHSQSVLQYRFEMHPTKESRKLREETLIKQYVLQFGEVPPLNSAIPNRHSAWKALQLATDADS